MNADSITINDMRGADNNQNRPETWKVKICLLGDGAVGKTSLINRFVKQHFTDRYLLTIGTNTYKKRIAIERPGQPDIYLSFIIWDIMGQLTFRQIFLPQYLKGSRGALLVCDLTRRETLERLDDWMDLMFVEWGEIPLVFIGNKKDLTDCHEFSKGDLDILAEDFGCTSFLTSAKTGEGVEEAFQALGKKIIDDPPPNLPMVKVEGEPKPPRPEIPINNFNCIK
jgi:small GTP-binding protein